MEFSSLKKIYNYSRYATKVRKVIFQWTGIPISIGIGETKTLAKVANHIVKNNQEMNKFITYLYGLLDNKLVIVDASKVIHLQTFTYAIKALLDSKRFLFRSAASLINALAGISSRSNKFSNFSALRIKENSINYKPGIIIIGSHVPLADKQLKVLLDHQSRLYFAFFIMAI